MISDRLEWRLLFYVRENQIAVLFTEKVCRSNFLSDVSNLYRERMSSFNKDYYVIHKPLGRDDLPFLKPDVNTEDRKFRFEKQPMGSPPFVFENGSREYNQKRGVKSVRIPPDILFSGTDLVVPTQVREALIAMDIPRLEMHPAVYIHDDGKWYENYWYLTFTERFDCWDRNTSDFEQDEPPIRLGGFELYQIYSYSLNPELLAQIPLEKRLLFKMGSSLDAFVLCHQSLFKLFFGDGENSAQLTPISEY